MKQKFLALALLSATMVASAPHAIAQTTASTQTTRAQEILDRNTDRNALIAQRDAEKTSRDR